jgi:hypothetical protein
METEFYSVMFTMSRLGYDFSDAWYDSNHAAVDMAGQSSRSDYCATAISLLSFTPRNQIYGGH